MTPLVSVVIPAFNHAPFVAETIESVLGQSLSEFEIVITDDGSSDGTVDVIRTFQDPRIRLEVFPENRGAVVALNSAIRRAAGEFVCYVSSDDYFLPGKLERQVAFLRDRPDVSAVFGLPTFIDERGAPLAPGEQFNGEIFDTPVRNQLDGHEQWLKHLFFAGNCLCHPTAMVRRAVFDETGLFDPRLANLPDFDMWVRLSMRHDLAVLPEPLTVMRIRDGNRNMSAPRRDSLLRTHFEQFEVLKHYTRLPLESLRRIFADDIARHELAGIERPDTLLAELAVLSPSPVHALFALDLLFEHVAASDDRASQRLIELTGNRDLFGLDIAARLAHAEAARVQEEALRRQSDAERHELARLTQDLERTIRDAATEVEGLQRSRIFALAALDRRVRQRVARLAAALARGTPARAH
jgi:glycosyltransferase involved in cell wall biosynthesis